MSCCAIMREALRDGAVFWDTVERRWRVRDPDYIRQHILTIQFCPFCGARLEDKS